MCVGIEIPTSRLAETPNTLDVPFTVNRGKHIERNRWGISFIESRPAAPDARQHRTDARRTLGMIGSRVVGESARVRVDE